MLATLAAEYRKLLTIRSTYIISSLSILFLTGITFWFVGYKTSIQAALNQHLIADGLLSNVGLLAIFAAIMAILSITHEYRYNTIMYSLTASNSRTKVLLSKLIATTSIGLVYVAVGLALSVGAVYVGFHVADIKMIDQSVNWGDLLWRLGFFTAGLSLMGLLLGVLFRNVVGAVTTILLAPSTIEPLLGLVLKENMIYLPFNALYSIIGTVDMAGTASLSHPKAAWVFAIYLVVGWIVAWLLFMRRDAN